MARRRLYGETQKKRKKRDTKVLKRQGTASRVQTTHLPAPFERSGELQGQDIAFLEAMVEMGVKRMPGNSEIPERQENFQRIHFAAEEEQRTDFQAAMESLRVRPLAPGTAPSPPSAHTTPHHGAPSIPLNPEPPGVAQSSPAAGGPPPIAPAHSRGEGPDSSLREAGILAAEPPQAAPSDPTGYPAGTVFRMDEEDSALMESWLDEEEFDPREKFQGAPTPQRPRAASLHAAAPPTGREPDAELDLHGKTQEEAIRMVQQFLLSSHGQRLREVLIITGQGHHSGGHGPVLRHAVYNWLERNGGRFARAFEWASPAQGGQGAIRVVLK